jgi:hypothetical protein
MSNAATIQETLKKIEETYPILGAYVVGKSIDFCIDSFVKHTPPSPSSPETEHEHFIKEYRSIDILKQYISLMLEWSEKDNVIRSLNSKNNTDYYVTQSFKRLEIQDPNENLLLKDVLTHKKNYIFKGGPGTGKSTFLKHLINTSYEDSNFIKRHAYFPFLLKCRDFSRHRFIPVFPTHLSQQDNKKNPGRQLSQEREKYLIENTFVLISILSELGFYIRFPNKFKNEQTYISWTKELEALFFDTAESNNMLFLVDGYDEISDTLTQRVLVDILNTLTLKAPSANFILTTREVTTIGILPKTDCYEIKFFGPDQIKSFLLSWFSHEPESGQLLLSKLIDCTYYDTLCRPLILGFICILFEKNNNDIPLKPSDIYYEIVELLVVKWERDNRLVRSSNYLNFTKEKKIRFLSEFAYVLTKEKQVKDFTRSQLKEYLKGLLNRYNISHDDLEPLVEEIETHTGLFLKIGNNKYTFSHFSLQEFLAAYFIFNIGSTHKSLPSLMTIPEIISICVALSVNPNFYFSDLYFNFLAKFTNESHAQILIFLERLMIESPEFYEDEIMGIAFLSLYSGLLTRINNFNTLADNALIERAVITESNVVEKTFIKVFGNTSIRQSVLKALLDFSPYYSISKTRVVYIVKKHVRKQNDFVYPKYLILDTHII